MDVTMINQAQSLSRAVLSFALAGHRRACLVLTLATLLCCLPGFFVIPPTDRDEGRFAQASKQMIETGDLINIRYQGEARNKKPVGIHWMQAGIATLSGYGADAPIWVYRLPSLLGALAAVLLTYWALLPLIGRQESLIAAMLLAATFMLGIEARIAKTDAVLLATTTAAMGALIRVYLGPKTVLQTGNWLIFWLAIAVGLLIKGPITPLVVGLTATTLVVYHRSAAFLRALRPIYGVMLVLLISLPWFIAIAVQTQGAFFQGSLGHDMFEKIGGAAEQHWGPPGYYAAAFWVFAWPAAPFLLVAWPWLWANRRDQSVMTLLAWLLPTWVLFEVVFTKLPHYVLPTYPALMGLIALALVRMGTGMPARWRQFWLVGLWLFPLLLGFAAIITVYRVEDVVLYGAIVFTVLSALLGFVVNRLAGRHLPEAVPLSIAVASLLYLAVMQSAAPGLRTIWLSKTLADKINEISLCPRPQLAIAGYAEPSFVFLTRTDTYLADVAGSASFLSQAGCRLAIVDALRRNGAGELISDEFQQQLQALHVKAEKIGEVTGRNVNGFALRRMEIWRRLP
jgi:4-amino-4-deoxy-L-arabinose transferase-like glycosyltransferase